MKDWSNSGDWPANACCHHPEQPLTLFIVTPSYCAQSQDQEEEGRVREEERIQEEDRVQEEIRRK